jgi:hypothetical protein
VAEAVECLPSNCQVRKEGRKEGKKEGRKTGFSGWWRDWRGVRVGEWIDLDTLWHLNMAGKRQ